MENYTIYCTTNQTIKAFELGVPIEEDYRYKEDIMFEEKCLTCERQLVPPTAEQMIGWLETQGKLRIGIDANWCFWCYTILDNRQIVEQGIEYQTRKEATLAAIDAALDYLNKTNK